MDNIDITGGGLSLTGHVDCDVVVASGSKTEATFVTVHKTMPLQVILHLTHYNKKYSKANISFGEQKPCKAQRQQQHLEVVSGKCYIKAVLTLKSVAAVCKMLLVMCGAE